MLSNLAVAAVQSIAQRFIGLDNQLASQLSELAHQVLVVHVRDWQQNISVQYANDKLLIQLHPEQPEHSDCYISASSSTLLKLKDPSLLTALIRQNELDIEGDLHLAQAYSKAFNSIDIDWPEHMSAYLGDAPAQLLHQGIQQGKQHATQSVKKLDYMLTTLLQDELKVAIHPLELQQFKAANQQLSDDLVRIDMRIKKLTEALNK